MPDDGVAMSAGDILWGQDHAGGSNRRTREWRNDIPSRRPRNADRGKEACVLLKLIARIDNVNNDNGVNNVQSGEEQSDGKPIRLVSEFHDVFSGLALIKIDAKIHIDDSVCCA